jgi:hypothetical protein
MNIAELTEAYFADRTVERIRAYMLSGRRLARLTDQSLSDRWVDAYCAAAWAFNDDDRWAELMDLQCEFDLRGGSPPRHLVAAERALILERLDRLKRSCAPDPAAIREVEAELADLRARLREPKN